NSGGLSHVCLSFGHRPLPDRAGLPRHSFYVLSYADRGALVAEADGETVGRVNLFCVYLEQRPEGVEFAPRAAVAPPLPFPASGSGNRASWRGVGVVVSPERV